MIGTLSNNPWCLFVCVQAFIWILIQFRLSLSSALKQNWIVKIGKIIAVFQRKFNNLKTKMVFENHPMHLDSCLVVMQRCRQVCAHIICSAYGLFHHRLQFIQYHVRITIFPNVILDRWRRALYSTLQYRGKRQTDGSSKIKTGTDWNSCYFASTLFFRSSPVDKDERTVILREIYVSTFLVYLQPPNILVLALRSKSVWISRKKHAD